MRASSTSRTVSYASQQASQAKSNVNPADATSPFGQLLAATAPKQGPGQKDQKDTSDSGDKHADNTSAAKQDAKQDNSPGATQTQAQNAASTAPAKKTDKADKADKSDDKPAAKTENKVDDGQAAAAGQQAAPPVPPPQAPVATTAGDDDGASLAIDKIASAAQAGTPPSGLPADAAVPAPAAPKFSDAAAAQAASAQQAEEGQTGDLELQMATAARALAVQAGSKPAAAPDDTAETGAAGIAANGGQIGASSPNTTPAGTVARNSAKTGKSTSHAGQAGAGKNTDAGANAAQTGVAKNDIAPGDSNKGDNNKGDTDKSGTARIHAGQDGPSNGIARDKTDTADNAAAAELKTISAQAALDTMQPPAPKSPPPMQAANANFDISGIAPQPGLIPANIQQDIQVSAKPAPNLPALAVEIAARSQSGAKQFDIRLDPPELGRVDVRLSIDATGKASAHLSADQPRTLTLLQNDAAVLTRALRDAGLDVSQNGLNFSLRQQAENNSGNAGDSGRRGTSRAFSLTATADIDATAAAAAYRGVANGRLDIRV